jgi:hypothetical protein
MSKDIYISDSEVDVILSNASAVVMQPPSVHWGLRLETSGVSKKIGSPADGHVTDTTTSGGDPSASQSKPALVCGAMVAEDGRTRQEAFKSRVQALGFKLPSQVSVPAQAVQAVPPLPHAFT